MTERDFHLDFSTMNMLDYCLLADYFTQIPGALASWLMVVDKYTTVDLLSMNHKYLDQLAEQVSVALSISKLDFSGIFDNDNKE